MENSNPAPTIALTPAEPAFTGLYESGQAQVVWTRLVADLETPVSAYMKLVPDRAPSFLLESIEGGESRGRYSIIGLAPDIVWRAEGENAWINRTPATAPDAFESLLRLDPQLAPRASSAESTIDLPEELPPMAAGVFGYMGFDTVRLVEHLPDPRERAIDVPDALMIRPTLIVIFDTVKDELTIVTPVRPAEGLSAAEAYTDAAERLAGAVRALERPVQLAAAQTIADIKAPEPTSNTTPAEYMAMVQRAKDYITAGDAFQIVLSQRFTTPFTLAAFLALSRAAAHQPITLPLLPRIR